MPPSIIIRRQSGAEGSVGASVNQYLDDFQAARMAPEALYEQHSISASDPYRRTQPTEINAHTNIPESPFLQKRQFSGQGNEDEA